MRGPAEIKSSCLSFAMMSRLMSLPRWSEMAARVMGWK